ncbi:transposase [Streptomyces sp. NPDC058818]|uniref:IS110 family transposase n=1 Tax=Streptomyces sp. NPDC058818 TaxID=3346640 RepID=UPI0036A110AE
MTVAERHGQIWVGIDAGKAHHWAVGINAGGEKVFSRKVINGEEEILALMAAACEMADEVRWAVDICGRASTLLLALLIAHGQSVVYVPGRTVNRMSAAYRDEGKTDAKDALVIADTARMRQDFTHLSLPDETVANLRLLTAHRADLIADREIRETFHLDECAEVIESLPGMGPILGAEFLAIVGDLSHCADVGRRAAHAGLAPVARDSGRRTGKYHRPKRYHRRLRHVFYTAAQTAMMRPGPSRDYYLMKRAEGLLHVQALLALARRRVDVLWAMLRDKRCFTLAASAAQSA